nr:MAG TPA: hypothetical protein [Caudoviricetes sp.]
MGCKEYREVTISSFTGCFIIINNRKLIEI